VFIDLGKVNGRPDPSLTPFDDLLQSAATSRIDPDGSTVLIWMMEEPYA
jgi:hypothetical protein